jgi:hypothetical protein
MPTQTKMLPFIMLVYGPEVVDTSSIKSTLDKALCHLPLSSIRINRLEI